MTKTITTLVEDIEETIAGRNGWDDTVGQALADNIAYMASKRFSAPQEPRGYLSLSALGSPCDRKTWLKVNRTELSVPLRPNALLKFFYGDLIEELVLSLAMVSGHKVEGLQTRVNVHGVSGSRDAVIDGMVVDVKSASPFGFKKFKEGNLREEDPFGYISQLSSYVYAAKDDPLVTDKTHGAFLAIDKVNGHVCLDVYDFSEELKNKEAEVERIKAFVSDTGTMPEKAFEAVPQSKTSPNMKLPMECSYCDFKKTCWPMARKFIYSTGPVFLTSVPSEPKVFEELEWKD